MLFDFEIVILLFKKKKVNQFSPLSTNQPNPIQPAQPNNKKKMAALFSFPDDFFPKVIFTLNESVEDQVPIISHQTKVSLYAYFPTSPPRGDKREKEMEKDKEEEEAAAAIERINVREKKVQELLSLSFSKLFQAISLYEQVRSTHGHEINGKKKILLLDMPLERQFACQAPDYRSICTPDSAYLDTFNISNGHVKFIYLHSNGSLYAVYKTPTSIHVDLMQDLDDYLAEKSGVAEKSGDRVISLLPPVSPTSRTSRDLVTIFL